MDIIQHVEGGWRMVSKIMFFEVNMHGHLVNSKHRQSADFQFRSTWWKKTMLIFSSKIQIMQACTGMSYRLANENPQHLVVLQLPIKSEHGGSANLLESMSMT